MRTTTPTAEPATDVDRAVRLAIIAEQAYTPGSPLARIATAYLEGGAEAARAAIRPGNENAERRAERVIAFMTALRTASRRRYWRVGYAYKGKAIEGTSIQAPAIVRAQHEWAARLPGVDAENVHITEYTDTETAVPVNPGRLPADGNNRPPHIPGAHEVHRFYQWQDEGPAILPTASAARQARAWLDQVRPRRFALPPVLLDVVRVVEARRVELDQVNPL